VEFEVVVAGTVVVEAVAAAVGSSVDLEGIDQKEEERRLVVRKRRLAGDPFQGR
jgi:hypothetical protein